MNPVVGQMGGSPYVFLSLGRLRRIDSQIRTKGRPPIRLDSNLLPRFRKLQGKARAHLAEQAEVPVEKIEWRQGTIHDLRNTSASTSCSGSWVTRTNEYYLEVGDDLAERVRGAFTA